MSLLTHFVSTNTCPLQVLYEKNAKLFRETSQSSENQSKPEIHQSIIKEYEDIFISRDQYL